MSVATGLTPDEVTHALDIARGLAGAGVPLFAAEPALDGTGRWNPKGGSGGTGYWLPPHWHLALPDPGAVAAWRPGMALCAVGGHAADFLDVDPRNGGATGEAELRTAGAWPVSYGRAATPSGGTHDLIAPLGVGSSGRGKPKPGIDVKGGDPSGDGRGFVFVAPTVRASKVDGTMRPYRWLVAPDLAGLCAAADDRSGAALADMVRVARTATNGHQPSAQEFMVQSGPWVDIAATLAGGRNEGVMRLAAALRGRGGWRLDDALAYMHAVVWPLIDQTQAGHEFGEEEFGACIRGVWRQYPDGEAERNEGAATSIADDRPATVVTLADVTRDRVRWLWDGYFPAGKLVIVDGDPSVGKSTVMLDLVARLSRAAAWPDGAECDESGDSLVMSAEDGLADTIVPRLLAAKADLSRVHALTQVALADSKSSAVTMAPPSLPRDIALLESVIIERNIRLVIVDVLMAY